MGYKETMLTHSTSLNWLTRHFKAYTCPLVVIEEFPPSGINGYFDWNIGVVSKIDDSEIFNQNGIIVLSYYTTSSEETLILHEFRHSLQFQLNGYWHVPDYMNGESLEDYNETSYEKDARLFELSLGMLSSITDYFCTPKISRSDMLVLPTPKFLSSLA